jgi:hypothetical protein
MLQSVAYSQGNLEEALAKFSEALVLTKELHGDQHADVAGVLQNVAVRTTLTCLTT